MRAWIAYGYFSDVNFLTPHTVHLPIQNLLNFLPPPQSVRGPINMPKNDKQDQFCNYVMYVEYFTHAVVFGNSLLYLCNLNVFVFFLRVWLKDCQAKTFPLFLRAPTGTKLIFYLLCGICLENFIPLPYYSCRVLLLFP